jgi:preprotein translocase subunit SecE
MSLVFGDDNDRLYRRGHFEIERIEKPTLKERFKELFYILLILANIALGIYSLYFVIRYIIEFKKTRD